jgi:hypothetical protein
MHSFVRIGVGDRDCTIVSVCSFWPDRPPHHVGTSSRPARRGRSHPCDAVTAAGAIADAAGFEPLSAPTATTGPTSMRASVGSCLLRLERTASGSLTIAVDGDFDRRAAIALVRTFDVMDAPAAPMWIDLGWVSRLGTTSPTRS